MATTAVTLDDFPLIGTTPGGGRAKVTGFDGWLTSTSRHSRDFRTGRHGGFSSTGLKTPREMSLKGIITYADADDCATEQRVMLALGVSGLPVPVVVTNSSGTLTVDVDVDEANVTPLNELILSFEFSVTAEDAFVRASTGNTPVVIGAASSATVNNAGTVAADLIVTLTSPGTVVLTAGGPTLTTSSLPSGAVINTGACTVLSSADVDLFTSVLIPQMPAVPAGGGLVAQAGTAGLSVVTFDTYA